MNTYPSLLTTALLVLFSFKLTSAQTTADFLFTNVQVISMEEEAVQENQAVAVKNGTIIHIGDFDDSMSYNATTRIDGKGRFLMPGLADMHVHVRWDPQAMFNLFVAHGVTTVVNMYIKDGGGRIDHVKLRAELESGKRIGPRYLVAGDHFEDDYPSSLEEVETVLNEHVASGYDFVKIHGDLPPAIYDALISGARSRDLRIVGHAQHLRPLADSLHIDALEHAEELLYVSPDPKFATALEQDFLSAYRQHAIRLKDPAYRTPIIEEIARSGIYVDPTLIVYKMVGEWASDTRLSAMQEDPMIHYIPESVKARWLSPLKNPYQEEDFPITTAEVEQNLETLFILVKEMNDAGVPMLLGTDTFGTLVPGYSVHQELELLVRAGLTPFEALKAGTVNVAAHLNESNKRGTISQGSQADFILLDRNPLTDIRNSQSVSGVFTRDQWHGRAEVEQLMLEALSN